MELVCENCRAVIQVPEERVPQNSAFRLTCPRCKRGIVGSTKSSNESQRESDTRVVLPQNPSGIPFTTTDNPEERFPEAMASLQPGQSAALLCISRKELHGGLPPMLESMGYAVDMPVTTDHALQRLRFNQYDVLVLVDDFEGTSPNPVTAYLTALNMNIRREMFVVLIGGRFKTADHLQAFVESANLVLHSDDLPQFVTHLSRGLGDHKRFYKVFSESLTEVGKKLWPL